VRIEATADDAPADLKDFDVASVMAEVQDVLARGQSVARWDGDRMLVLTPGEWKGRKWALLLWFDVGDTEASLRQAAIYMAAVAVAMLIVGGLLAFQLARGIAYPLQHLAEEAVEIGKGNLDRQADVEAGEEVRVLSDAFNHMTGSLKAHIEQLKQTTIEKERLESEMRIAAEVQQAMLPNRLPKCPGLEIAAFNEPARMVGGDFYDAMMLPNGQLSFAIGDVSGKGLPAALLGSQYLSIGRTLAVETLGAGRVLDRSNAIICHTAETRGLFITICCGIYDPDGRVLTLANAGHPPPLLCRDGRPPEPLETHRTYPLGIVPDYEAREQSVSLQPNDLLVFYTDGVTDARDAEGEMFTTDRLLEAVRQCADRSADEVVAHIRAAVRDFMGPVELYDDLTLLTVRVTG